MSDKTEPKYMHYAFKVDTDHLLSREQIEMVKNDLQIGDYVSFRLGESVEEGIVEKKFPYIFKLENGRSYTYVEYILGSPEALDILRRFHPIKELIGEPDYKNYYSMPARRY